MITGTLSDKLIDALEPARQVHYACMDRAFDCYAGRHPASLSIASDAPNDNVKINYGRLIVNAGVQALVGKEPDWAFDSTEDNPDGNVAARDAWDAWATAQRTFLLQLQKIAANGGRAGTAYYKLSTNGEGVQVRVIDPRTVTPFWDPENVDDVWAYLIRWAQFDLAGNEVERRQIVERTSETAWTIRDEWAKAGTLAGSSRGWQSVTPAVTWPYPWPPVGHCQNLPESSECYGQPDLPDDVIDLIYGMNRVASNTNKVIRLHAHPKLIGFGMDAQDIDVAPDQMVTINNTEARVEAISAIGDVTASLSYFKALREALHEITRTPEVATGKMENVGQLSGVALQILYGPLVAQTEQKQLTYGPMLEEMARRVLALLDISVNDVKIKFQNTEPVDRLEELQGAQLAQSLGASRQTTLEEVGYDASKELALSEDENAAAMAAAQQSLARGDVQPFGAGPNQPGQPDEYQQG